MAALSRTLLTSASRIRRATQLIVGIALASAATMHAAFAAEELGLARVLYINSYHRGYAWSDAIERGLAEALHASGRKIELSIEYLDSRRFPDRGQSAALADALEIKYRNVRHDLVVVSDNDAYAFAIKYRTKLFAGLPIVFCGYNLFRYEALRDVADVAGVNEEVDFSGTLDLALGMHPQAAALVFIASSATPSGARNLRVLEDTLFPAYKSRYDIVFLKDQSMYALRQRLADLGRNHLVFIVGEASDFKADGDAAQQEFAREIASASPVPVYSFWNFYLNSGVLGGRVIRGEDQGRAAAALSLKILSGTPAGEIPVIMTTPTAVTFDFNAMKRFAIPEDALPGGSIVINRPGTFYETYRRYVWGTTVALVLLSVVVVILTLLLRRSRRLEAEVRASEHRFRVLVEQAPEAIVVFDADAGHIVDANANALRLTGYSREELFRLKPEQLYSQDRASSDQLPARIHSSIDRIMVGDQLVLERNLRSATAEEIPCEVRSVRLPSEHRRLIRVSFIDISHRKQAEAALRERQAKIESLFRGAPVGIAEVTDKRILAVNNRMCEMFGYEPEELIGQSAGKFFPSAEDWERVRTEGFAQVGKRGYATIETSFCRKDGSKIDVLFGAAPIVPEDPNALTITIMDITERNVAVRALAEAFAQLKLLSGRLLHAQETERRAIANELHDEIGQALTAVKLKLHALGKRLASASATAADVESCMTIADHALVQVRDLSLNLRPPQLDLMGLEAALRWLLDARTEAAALDTYLSASLDSNGRSPQIDITCFRIVQEALNNAIKHAHARQFWVSVRQQDDAVEVRIEDDGTGFNYEQAKARATQGSSIGLLSMEERVALMGGSFELDSRLGGGTTICARIPLHAESGASPQHDEVRR